MRQSKEPMVQTFLTIIRDISLCSKGRKTAASELYLLDEFPVKKTENVRKGYMLGRYGAVPYIREDDLEGQ